VPCLSSQKDQNREKGIQHPLIITAKFTYNDTNVKTGKQKSTEKEHTTETLGKFTVCELRDTQNASIHCVCKEAKKKTHVLINAQHMT